MLAIPNIVSNCIQNIQIRFPQQLFRCSHFFGKKSTSVYVSSHSHCQHQYLSSSSSYHSRDTTRCTPSKPTFHTKRRLATVTFKGVTLQFPDTIADLKTPYSPTYYYNMSSKHLATGSTCPPLQEGKLRIYNMRFCPYAQRAVLVAIAKGIPHDIVNVNLKDKPEFLLERNPLGKVPTIEMKDGSILYESLIVADYLDEIYKNRPLNSPDPFQKALDRMWVEHFNQVITQHYKILFTAADGKAQASHVSQFVSNLALFEKELSKRDTKFFGGDNEPGMLDYMIWPWFERFPALKVLFPNLYDYENGKQEHPRLESWRKAMKEDPPVKEYYLSTEVHIKFIQAYMEGSPNYDILEEGAKL